MSIYNFITKKNRNEKYYLNKSKKQLFFFDGIFLFLINQSSNYLNLNK